MRISNGLGATLLPLALLLACAGEVDDGSDSNRATQTPATGNEETEPEPCGAVGDTRACTTESGEIGLARCEPSADREHLAFSGCGAVDCTPGEVTNCGLGGEFAGLTRSCTLYEGRWTHLPWDCATPLVLSFDNGPVEFTQAAGWFDLVGAELSLNHAWVSARTPWLVLDLNENGSVDDGRELFGSMTRLASGARASNGFVALAELDTNSDGRVSADDAEFARLALWRDRNQDRVSAPDELEPLARSGVTGLSLEYTNPGGCAATACEVERASFEYTDAAGRVRSGTTIDVHFRAY